MNRERNLLFHAGAFDDDDVTHVEGDVNPVRDLEIISEELRLKDIEFLNGHLEKLEKLVVRGNDKKLKPEYVSIRSNIYGTNKSFYVRNNSLRSSKRMEDEIKSVGVVVYFLERINRIIHFPSWIDPRQFPISPSPPLVPRLVCQKLFEASSQIYPFVSSKPILISSLCRIRC